MPEPAALERMKRRNDEEARLLRIKFEEEKLASVTSWHEASETRPGANAKAESINADMCDCGARRERAPHRARSRF